MSKIRSHSHLRFLGLHSHIGSQIFVVDGFVAAAERLLDVHAQLLKTGDVPELNLGGGFGIAYTEADKPLGIADMATRIMQAVAAKCASLGIEIPKLAFEPGRIIAGPAGITLYSVGTIKDVTVSEEGMGATRKYVSIDGGMSDNPRPQLYDAVYRCLVANRADQPRDQIVTVAGKHCETDILIWNTPTGVIGEGDVLAVQTTGAYNHAMASNYNRFRRPAVVFVQNGQADVVYERETLDDLLRQDRLPARLQSS